MDLTKLDSENITQIVSTIATPKALRNILLTHSAIQAVREQLFANIDSQIEIEKCVKERLIDLKPEIYFQHKPAFCAL